MAPTLAYDATITADGTIPAEFATISTPTLAIESESSPDWLRNATQALAAALRVGHLSLCPASSTNPTPKIMAGELKRFFV
jgi:hypothetical protein